MRRGQRLPHSRLSLLFSQDDCGMTAGSFVEQWSNLALIQASEAADFTEEVENVTSCNTMGQTEQVQPSFLR
jgi:hypothetical protein